MKMDPDLQRALEDMRCGKMDEALSSVRSIVQSRPDDCNALQILALLLIQSGRHEEALPHLARSVEAWPLAPQYRNNYANVLLQLKRYREAIEQWERSVQIDPGFDMGWLGLACARVQLPDFAGAIEAARTGLKRRPGWRELNRTLVIAMEAIGQVTGSLAVCRQSLARDPHDSALRSIFLLLLNYQAFSPESIASEHREFGQRQLPATMPARTDPDPDRRIRVGILSADLRTHSVAFFAEPLLRFVPPTVDLTVFSLHAAPDDDTASRLASMVARWEEVGPLNDEALNAKIRNSKVDVLVELHGHTPGNRLTALAAKPAPVIVSAIGYPNTTGVAAVDWRVVDSVTDPPGSESFCTERLLRLDPCFLCYTPPEDTPPPGMPDESGSLTFGSFNALSKISDQTIGLWSRVLDAVPGSRLLLKAVALVDPAARASLQNRLEAGGIPASRIEILPYSPTIWEHLLVYSRIHIALDTTPYNGTTTTCEALWMGVPVVTLLGDRHAARVGASLLGAMGRNELVAQTPGEYVDKAVELAGSPKRLQGYRESLRQEMSQSPLTDQPGYAGRFYHALRNCWRDWCKDSKNGR